MGTEEDKEERTLFLHDVALPSQPCQENPFTRMMSSPPMGVGSIDLCQKNLLRSLTLQTNPLKDLACDLAKTMNQMQQAKKMQCWDLSLRKTYSFLYILQSGCVSRRIGGRVIIPCEKSQTKESRYSAAYREPIKYLLKISHPPVLICSGTS